MPDNANAAPETAAPETAFAAGKKLEGDEAAVDAAYGLLIDAMGDAIKVAIDAGVGCPHCLARAGVGGVFAAADDFALVGELRHLAAAANYTFAYNYDAPDAGDLRHIIAETAYAAADEDDDDTPCPTCGLFPHTCEPPAPAN